jgi:hypothetical protein
LDLAVETTVMAGVIPIVVPKSPLLFKTSGSTAVLVLKPVDDESFTLMMTKAPFQKVEVEEKPLVPRAASAILSPYTAISVPMPFMATPLIIPLMDSRGVQDAAPLGQEYDRVVPAISTLLLFWTMRSLVPTNCRLTVEEDTAVKFRTREQLRGPAWAQSKSITRLKSWVVATARTPLGLMAAAEPNPCILGFSTTTNSLQGLGLVRL